MLNNVIKKNKGVLVLVIMFLLFSFVASRRVDTLEKFNYSNGMNLVYNR